MHSLKQVLKVKKMRNKLLFTLLMVACVRLGSQIPVPGIDLTYFKEWFQNNANSTLNFFSAFTGGSFERFSIFGLGITPYITASIIIQLLTIAIPSLDELRKDGDYGKKKMDWINRSTAIGLAVLESLAMAIGFGRSGLLPNMALLRAIFVVLFLTGGTALLILMGWAIDKKGIGNGISIILMVNIITGIPQDFAVLYERFVKSETLAKGILNSCVIVALVAVLVMLVVLLNEGYRKIPIQYSNGLPGKKIPEGQRSSLPIKVNVANVMPVIFASTLLAIPQMIASIAGRGYGGGISAYILNMVNQNNWFDMSHPQYSVGLLLYLAMVFFFAFFYTSISFNPMEIADNLKKQGAAIPGIRQGKPTEKYLQNIIEHLVVIGATGLIIVVMIPLFFSSVFHASLSFGGTSIIIIVGVILETLEQSKSEMQIHEYKSFLW